MNVINNSTKHCELIIISIIYVTRITQNTELQLSASYTLINLVMISKCTPGNMHKQMARLGAVVHSR